MARPPKCRCICSVPKTTCFEPHGQPGGETVNIGYDEYEVIRLLDYELLSQKQCADKMSISRSTVARMYEHARQQIADALVNGKRITISGDAAGMQAYKELLPPAEKPGRISGEGCLMQTAPAEARS